MNVSQYGTRPATLTTFGTVKNASIRCFKSVVVEVKYFGSDNKLIDTVTQEIYGVVIPGGEEVAFRVREVATQDKEAYASQSARIVSADLRAGQARTPPTFWETAGEYALSWLGLLVMIGIWVSYIRSVKSKESPTGKIITLLEKQTALSATKNESLERIATALEAKRKID